MVRKTYPMLVQPGGLIFAARRLLLPLAADGVAGEIEAVVAALLPAS